MAVKRFTKMEVKTADDLVFGDAKYPVSYGLGMKAGAGFVVPEINFAPRPGAEKNPDTLRREYVDYITKDIMDSYPRFPSSSAGERVDLPARKRPRKVRQAGRCGPEGAHEEVPR